MSEFLNSINSTKAPDTSWETEARSFEPDSEPVKATPEETPKAQAEAPAETAPEAQAQAAPEVADPSDDVQKVVPLKALQEERRANKELAERLAQVEQMIRQAQQPQQEPQQEEQGPDPETDPIGALKWERQKRLALEAESQQQQQVHRLRTIASASVQEFKAQTPDYNDAYQYAMSARMKQLAALGYDQQTIIQTVGNEELDLAARALNAGRNPGQVIYEFAQSWGYQPKGAAPATAPTAPAIDPVTSASLQKAKAAAATSISTGGKPPKSDFDPNAMLNTRGAAFDAQWEKFAKQAGKSSMFRE